MTEIPVIDLPSLCSDDMRENWDKQRVIKL